MVKNRQRATFSEMDWPDTGSSRLINKESGSGGKVTAAVKILRRWRAPVWMRTLIPL